jgi:hypothetical protein
VDARARQDAAGAELPIEGLDVGDGEAVRVDGLDRGLTVEQALDRATPRVMNILARSGEEYSEFERELVRQTIRACLISQVSRANLYRIAGILVAGRLAGYGTASQPSAR